MRRFLDRLLMLIGIRPIAEIEQKERDRKYMIQRQRMFYARLRALKRQVDIMLREKEVT